MSLYIIHLTDLHIKDANDQILMKADALAKRCCSEITDKGDVLIAVTGDMAYDGKTEQFSLFRDFMQKIVDQLRSVPNINTVSVFTVPGNHDCDFTKATTVRSTLMSAMNYRGSDGFDADCVKHITTEVQSDYLSFSEASFCGLNIEESLFKLTEATTSVGKIAVAQFNSAWFSSLHEEAGHLCMPVNLLADISTAGYDLVIALTHHPLHWLHPDNKSAFEIILRNSADIFLCGHEHMHDSLRQQGNAWNYHILEGKELQAKSDSSQSAFAIYELDETLTNLKIKYYKYNRNEYILDSSESNPFSRNQSAANAPISPNQATLCELHDLGAILHHPYVDEITLDDIFVWPSLEETSVGNSEYVLQIDSTKVYEQLTQAKISIIYGEESSGKTTLAKQVYISALREGYCCIMANGNSFHGRKRDSIKAEIDALFIEQYSANFLERFNQQSRDGRILIIDDFEQIAYKNDRASFFIDTLQEFFSSVILFTENQNSIPFILNKVELGEIPFYRIKHFGHTKRNELIVKWYSLGNARAAREPHEFEALVDRATRTINDFIGRFDTLMPATPITILSLLQTIDTTGSTVINGHSYTYERLVQYSLDRLSKGSQEAQTVYISILSNIAYMMLVSKRLSIASTDLIDSISTYAKEALLPINALEIIERLIQSKILIHTNEDKYRFRYPYLYYYFCGKYIAKNISRPDIKERIDYMSSKLHVVEYGNIMVFICHFLSNEEVLHSILLNALYTLDGVPSFDFHKPYSLLDEVVTDISQMLDRTNVGAESDVSEARQRELMYQDNQSPDKSPYHEHSDIIDDNSSDDTSLELSSMVSALRIIDVLGQILRNYPGDITGQNKIDTVEQIKDLSMRIVGLMYSGLSSVKDDVIADLIRYMKNKHPRISESALNEKVRTMFNSLVFTLVCSMIHKASSTIATPLLLPVLEAMVENNPDDMAITLMLYDTDMLCQTTPRYDDIIALHKRLKGERCLYAQETLRLLVAQHLRRRHCGESTRNRLCSEFSFKKQAVLPPAPLPK